MNNLSDVLICVNDLLEFSENEKFNLFENRIPKKKEYIAGYSIGHVDVKELRQVIRKLASVRNQGAGDPVITVYKSHRKVSVILGFMNWHEKTNRYDIIINTDHSKCWQRFTLCKELCQVYLFYSLGLNEEYYNLNNTFIEDLDNPIESLKLAWQSDEHLMQDDGLIYDPETFAIWMAIELMIPYSTREALARHYLLYRMHSIKMYDIAESILMPETILAEYFSSGMFARSSNLLRDMGIIKH